MFTQSNYTLAMAVNLTNSTVEAIVSFVNRGLNAVCGPLVFLAVFLLMILSFCWSLYFLYDIIKGKKSKDHYINRNMREEVIKNILNNQNIHRIKRYVLFAICFSECTFIFFLLSVILADYIRRNHAVFERPSSSFHKLSFLFSNSSESFWSHFLTILGVNLFLLLLMLIRILTQYMANSYNFFRTKYSFSFQFIKSIGILLFLTLLGPFSIFTCLFAILYIAFLFYEFGLFLQASGNLRKFLYNRYFDAKFHEYQNTHVIAYYKGAYKEYRITSFLLSLSLASHVLCMSLMCVYPFLIAVLYRPENFPHILIGQDLSIRFSALPIYLMIFDRAMSSLIEILFTLGMCLLVAPYIFVSVNYIVFFIRRRIKPKQYRFAYFSDPDKVKSLISRLS